MKEQTVKIKDLLSGNTKKSRDANDLGDFNDIGFAEQQALEEVGEEIPISFMEIDTLTVPRVQDLHGRLSDVFDFMMGKTNMSVIPFAMAKVSESVTKLMRHDIFELGGSKYAMSRVPRNDVIKSYSERIIKTLESGLDFKESLSLIINYEGHAYKTIALSEVEWTFLTSLFREYRPSLHKKNDDLVLTVSMRG